jgi:hypothetical protein
LVPVPVLARGLDLARELARELALGLVPVPELVQV